MKSLAQSSVAQSSGPGERVRPRPSHPAMAMSPRAGLPAARGSGTIDGERRGNADGAPVPDVPPYVPHNPQAVVAVVCPGQDITCLLAGQFFHGWRSVAGRAAFTAMSRYVMAFAWVLLAAPAGAITRLVRTSAARRPGLSRTLGTSPPRVGSKFLWHRAPPRAGSSGDRSDGRGLAAMIRGRATVFSAGPALAVAQLMALSNTYRS